MTTTEENELLTRTGPGTPAGRLLRRYWQPVAVSDELPPGAAPLPVRILGEDLVLFRPDSSGRPDASGRADEQNSIGLLDLHCSHRGADLSYGRTEDGGLRCIYHGWLYDANGRCLEQPGEPAGSIFHERIRHKAYPCIEAGGLILTYMGGNDPPALTPYDFLGAPPERRSVTKGLSECNYLQGNEGNFDTQHLGVLHRHDRVPPRSAQALYANFRHGTMAVEETDFGVRLYTVIPISVEENLVALHNFVLPNLSAFGTTQTPNGYGVNWHVPIDDQHHWVYRIQFDRERELQRWSERAVVRGLDLLDNGYLRTRTRANRYLQDREEMRDRTFAGLGYDFADQDACVTEGMGPIQDRASEHLGYTDQCIMAQRRLLIRCVAAVEAGREPPNVVRSSGGNPVRELVAHSEVLPSSLDWRTHWRRLIPASNEAIAGVSA